MKKLLLLSFVFFGLMSKSFSKNNYYYYYDQPISFTENNVSFAIYKNGAFDFYIDRVAGLNINFNSPHVSLSFNSGYNYNPYVQYDRYGAIIQVENIPIYYDYYGRVSRIGSVNINYYNGYVSRVGGLHIYYNGYGGYAHYSGYINRYNRHYVHTHHRYFHYPQYDYVVVSHKPYRRHYHPNRYVYHRNHKNNHYYKKRDYRHYAHNSKEHSSKYNRRATKDVPKRRSDYNSVARSSGNDKANDLFREQPVRDDSKYRRAVVNSNSKGNVSRTSETKRTSERTVRKEPVKRSATDMFKKDSPERRSSAQKTRTHKTQETSRNRSQKSTVQNSRNTKAKEASKNNSRKSATQKSHRTKPEHNSRSISKTRKVTTRS